MELIEVRRELHRHPETGFNEHWTSGFVAEKLRELGLQVFDKIAQTGVVGVLPGRSHDRSVGYRADMDALPIEEKLCHEWSSHSGCMHACGHDAHMTVALGVAQKLSQMKDELPCDVAFVFQPNEEGAPGEKPSGAKLMCDEGVLSRFHIGKMIALHCNPDIDAGYMGIAAGAVWAASGRFVVEVTGKSAHAAYPERGNDALWAASEMVSAIYSAVRRRRAPAQEVVSVCLLSAGTAFNVVAGQAHFEGIMRAPSRRQLSELGQIIDECVHGVASYCHVEVRYEQFYGADSVVNEPEITRLARQIWQPSGAVVDIAMSMASEDFSHFSERIPSFYAMMGVRRPGTKDAPPLHSEVFDIDESALEPAVCRMSELVLALC